MQKQIQKTFLITILLLGFFGLAKSSLAATYWISPTGAASNLAACSGGTPLNGSAACSYDKANGSGVAAGDTVYYRAGSYTGITGIFIKPYNTGTVGNVITFSAYNNEDVQVTGSGVLSGAVNLESSCYENVTGNSENVPCATTYNYIKVNDLHFNKFMTHLWIRFGTHNEISNCTFIGGPTDATQSNYAGAWAASYLHRGASYNWIHNNTFGHWGACEPFGNDTGVVFQSGLDTMRPYDFAHGYFTDHNLVENNEMYGGGHHVLSTQGINNIYRNNYVHNEPWCGSSSQFSTRVIFQVGYIGDGRYNVVEGNRIAYGGPKNKDEIGGSGAKIASPYNIWRYNLFLQNYANAILMSYYPDSDTVNNNHIYNNTIWHAGYGRYQYYPSGTVPSPYWDDRYTHGIDLEEDATGDSVYSNALKNNLFYQDSNLVGTQYSILSRYYDSGSGWVNRVPIFQTIANNWLDNAGDPKFVDISGTPDPANGSQWNFHLQSSSGAIDGGAALTTANGSGTTSSTLVVADAGYFSDGFGIQSQLPTANVNADWIAVGTTTKTVQISSINYATNTITLASPISWSKGDPVWLYKNSSGTRVLFGNAPDYGAYEYVPGGGDTTPPSSPTGLRVS